ncbi:MAG: hypothetical protein AAGC95_01900 [Pseudomonadota bacterium]
MSESFDQGPGRAALETAAEEDRLDAAGFVALGKARLDADDIDGAARAFETAIDDAANGADAETRAVAHGHLGVIAEMRDQWEAAEAQYEISLRISEINGRKEGAAFTRMMLAELSLRKRNFEAGADHAQRALDLYAELQDKTGRAAAYGTLGIAAKHQGAPLAAQAHFRRALMLCEAAGDTVGMGVALCHLGKLATDLEEYEKAAAYLDAARALDGKTGRKDGFAQTEAALGVLAHKRGDTAEACRRWSAAASIFIDLGAADEARRILHLMKSTGCPLH